MSSKYSYEFITNFEYLIGQYGEYIQISSPKYYHFISNNGYCGIFDEDFNIIVSPSHCYITINYWKSQNIFVGQKLIIFDDGNEYKKESWYELFDEHLNIITKERYDNIYTHFFTNIALVKLDNKYGFLKPDGEYAIPLIFDGCNHNDSFDRAILSISNRYGVIDSNGNTIVPFLYDNIQTYGKDYKAFLNDKTIWFDENGHQFESKIKNYGDYTPSSTFTNNNGTFVIVREELKHGEVYLTNIPRNYESNGTYFGVIDEDLKIIVPIIYREVDCNSGESIIKAVNDEGFVGYFDCSGNLIIDFIYEDTSSHYSKFSRNRAVVKANEKEYLINEKGVVLNSKGYDYISTQIAPDLLKVELNGKVGLLDRKDGEEIIAPIYDNISYINHHTFFVRVAIKDTNGEELWGIVDKNQNIVIPHLYHYISDFEDGLARVVLNKKFGIIDENNNIVLALEYDHLVRSDYNKQIFIARKGYFYAFLKVKY
ncbi:MAG: WG repeat-containing protein [Raineya sp.]|jgi:hypothetical protein|nr:WG repeat-containing protein [Raineya sp.]